MKTSSYVPFAFAAIGIATGFAQQYKYERLNRNDSALLIVDHQVGLFNVVRDFGTEQFHRQVLAHAAFGKAFGLPVVITTSTENGPTGPTMGEITKMYPNVTVIQRDGEVNAFDNPRFREAVAGLNKTQLIIGGIMTDVCTAFAVQSLREAGYSVWANLEASGTSTGEVRDAANQIMRDAGAHVVSFNAIFGELLRDWRTPPSGMTLLEMVSLGSPQTSFLSRSHRDAVNKGVIFPGVGFENLP